MKRLQIVSSAGTVSNKGVDKVEFRYDEVGNVIILHLNDGGQIILDDETIEEISVGL